MRRRFVFGGFAAISICLCGCGISPPALKEAWDADYPGDPQHVPPTPPISGSGQIEYEVLKRIYCDLKEAVQGMDDYKRNTSSGQILGPLLPNNWEAQVAISLQVDESTALNPGLALNTPMHSAITHFVGESTPTSAAPVTNGLTFPFLSTPQSYSFGLGATLSATATRIDKFNPVYSVKLLDDKKQKDVCNRRNGGRGDAFEDSNPPFSPARSSLLITSDLGIQDWLREALTTQALLTPASVPPKPLWQQRLELAQDGYLPQEITQIIAGKASQSSASGGGGGSGSKPNTVSLEIKFIIVSSGNATPTWKLVRVSANTGNSPLIAAGRTRTHDLIITFGPKDDPKTANDHLASQIAAGINAVRNIGP
jgi:hypothetical protein